MCEFVVANAIVISIGKWYNSGDLLFRSQQLIWLKYHSKLLFVEYVKLCDQTCEFFKFCFLPSNSIIFWCTCLFQNIHAYSSILQFSDSDYQSKSTDLNKILLSVCNSLNLYTHSPALSSFVQISFRIFSIPDLHCTSKKRWTWRKI